MSSPRARVAARLRVIYRELRRLLPAPIARGLQHGVVAAKTRRARRQPIRPLRLEGTGPVTLVDLRGVTAARLDEVADEIAARPSPTRKVLLLDRPDFLGLRSRGLTFEYVPPRDASTRWFPDDAAYAAFTEQRLGEIRATLGITGPLDRSFISQSR